MRNKIKVKGTLRVRVYDNDVLIMDHTSNNMVVNIGLENICKLLGGDPGGTEVTIGKIGTNNTAPDLTDTGIAGALDKPIATISYPTQSSVKFDWAIERTEANGITIVEYGLQTAGGFLLARIVKPPINKVNTFRVTCEWTLDFSNV